MLGFDALGRQALGGPGPSVVALAAATGAFSLAGQPLTFTVRCITAFGAFTAAPQAATFKLDLETTLGFALLTISGSLQLRLHQNIWTRTGGTVEVWSTAPQQSEAWVATEGASEAWVKQYG